MSDQIDLFVESNIVLFNRWPSNYETGVHIGSGMHGTMLTENVEHVLSSEEMGIIELLESYAEANRLTLRVHDESLGREHSRIGRGRRRKPYLVWRGCKLVDLPAEKEALFILLNKIKRLRGDYTPIPRMSKKMVGRGSNGQVNRQDREV